MNVNEVRREAFTLAELLVVICIIAVIVAIAFPVVGSARASSAGIKCIANQKSILAGFLSYVADHNGSLPCYGDFSGVLPPWWVQLSPYLGGTPEAPVHAGINALRCPAEKDGTRFATYGLNYGYSTYAPFSYDGNAPTYSGSMKLSRVPAGTYLLGDCLDPSPGGGAAVIYSPLLAGGWVLQQDCDGDGVIDSNGAFGGNYNYFAPRHGGAGFFGFKDGSVRKVTPKEWALNTDKMWGDFN